MITYDESIKMFREARELTISAVIEHIGDRTLALDMEFFYEEPVGDGNYTSVYAVRQLTKDGIGVQDIAEGADFFGKFEWKKVPDFVIQEFLNQLERNAVHDYIPDED